MINLIQEYLQLQVIYSSTCTSIELYFNIYNTTTWEQNGRLRRLPTGTLDSPLVQYNLPQLGSLENESLQWAFMVPYASSTYQSRPLLLTKPPTVQ